jgi:hypothetical protein
MYSPGRFFLFVRNSPCCACGSPNSRPEVEVVSAATIMHVHKDIYFRPCSHRVKGDWTEW